MNETLKKRLADLGQTEILGWVGERTAQRGREYRDRVGAIVSAGDCLAAKVRGTTEYTTNVFVDASGRLASVCSCPVGRNCKHGVALALCAAESLNSGKIFPEIPPDGWLLDREAILAEHQIVKKTKSPPPQPPVCIRVKTNPFDRFTPNGGRRHGSRFSFRVEEAGEVFHWDFLISTLIYLLAKGGLDYGTGEDLPLFTCSCGDAGCDGFWNETCTMTADETTLSIIKYGRIITFTFDRVRFEYWALLALYRMRGSPKLREDPGTSHLGREELDDYLETLLAIRPRCRGIWQRLKTKRRFDESDFAEFAAVQPGDIPSEDVRKALAQMFHFFPRPDLRIPGPYWEEKQRIAEQLEEQTVNELPMCIYGALVGKRWHPTELKRDLEIAFVREPAHEKGQPILRVANAATNETVGFLKYEEARFLSAMMDRHGLVLKNHVEHFERFGKVLPIRIDFEFRNPADRALDWGASLDGKDRLYFEMLRAVALKPGLVPAAELKDEVETIGRLLRDVADCPEIAFLTAWILASAREIEYRLTEEAVAKRRAYCDAVRRALVCEPVGGLLSCGDVTVLPLKAPFANVSLAADEVLSRVRSWIRLTWGREMVARPHVELSDFPPNATGFAAFRGRELLDVCLTGVSLAGTDLFDNFAIYDRPVESDRFVDAQEAHVVVSNFLESLPIRERGKDGLAPRFWLELGIHDGTYEIDENGRLVALRIIRMVARKQWVD